MPDEYIEPTPKDRKGAARLIAALLSNPATPATLCDAITDELDFYNEFLDYTNPAIVEASLLAFEKAVERGDVETFKDRIEDLIG
jgi:hypothetical protein